MWMKRWINYIRYSSATNPGQIINDNLYLKLEQDKTLVMGEDLFVVS